jgi:ABC-type nitrate/sulfonate/bicarbonate transport system substrate-binding protein
MGGALALGGLGGMFGGRDPTFAADGAALKPAHIINAGGDPTLVLQELLKQQGYFEQLGLDATTDNFGDGTKVMAALLSDAAEISVLSGISQVFPAIEKGGKFKIVAAAGLLPQLAVYSSKPDIKTLKDLEGKVVATSSIGALLHQLMVALMQAKGVDYTKVQFVNIGGGGTANVFRAVVAGTVDAGPAPIDVYDHQEQYGVHALTDGNMWTELPQFTYQAAFTTDEIIEKKRDVLVRELAAYAKLFRFVHSPDSKDAFVKAWQSALGGGGKDPAQQAKEAEYQWGFYNKFKVFSEDLMMSPERIDYMQRLNILVGNQQKMLPYDQVADMSLAQEAIKLIS